MAVIEHEVRETTVPERDVLHRAADLLESGEWGWCQGGARSGDGVCLLGAVVIASGGVVHDRSIDDAPTLYYRARRHLDKFGVGGIWNDMPGRTKAEVVAKLREVAESAA